MDLARAIESLVPAARYGGSVTANTQDAYDELRWDDEREKPTWQALLDVPDSTITSSDIDAERDRRISAGFEFRGVRYQSRLPEGSKSGDWDIFNGKALEATLAIMGGALPGDLRWADADEDFSWIAENNSRVPMDAQTVIDLCKAALAHRSRQTFAGSDIKALSPIPADYTDDKWWP